MPSICENMYFQFKPAPAAGALRMDGYWIWGASPIKGDDGRYHLIASRWSKNVTMLHWVTNSEVIRASADRPEGPYEFEEVVLPMRGGDYWDGMATHNPTIACHDGQFLIYYTGIHYDGGQPTQADDGTLFSEKWLQAWNSKRIGLAVADSICGPWQRMDSPILETRPGQWDAAITSNAAVDIRDDGRVTVVYKSADQPHPAGRYPGRFHLGVATAAHWTRPLERLTDGPLEIAGHPDHHLEDPYLWWNGSRYEMIAKDMTGEVCGEQQAGIHITSRDAKRWELSAPLKAYSRTIAFDDGRTITYPKRERPQVLVQDGKPTHLFNAILEKDDAGQVTDTWNCVAELA